MTTATFLAGLGGGLCNDTQVTKFEQVWMVKLGNPFMMGRPGKGSGMGTGGPQVDKFEQPYNLAHQMSLGGTGLELWSRY